MLFAQLSVYLTDSSVVLVFLVVKHVSISISTMSVDVIHDPGSGLSTDDQKQRGGPTV